MSRRHKATARAALLAISLIFLIAFRGFPQTQAAPSLAFAQQAYQEMANKNYEAAIKLFLKALEGDPANTSWRKDLAYAYVQRGSLAEALAQFEIVYKAHPEDLATALELGFLCNRLKREALARTYFQAAAQSQDPKLSAAARQALENIRVDPILELKQKGYELLQQNRRAEAIPLFEAALQKDPHDYATVMQLGYLYDAEGRKKKAEHMFRLATNSPNPQTVQQARTALRNIRGVASLWFGSVYVAPFYTTRFSNEINSLNAKLGLRPNRYFQPYLGLRLSRDTRSQTGRLPIIFNDNTAVFSAGIQSQPFTPTLVFYAEAGAALSLLDVPLRGRAIPDYRAGFNWFQPWGLDLIQATREKTRRAAWFAEAYSDVSYYRRYNDNVIGYLQLKGGLTFPLKGVAPLQVFAAVNFIKDANDDFYNNVGEFGPGLRFAPIRRFPQFQIQAQYIRGYYTTNAQHSHNPYGRVYHDCRLFIIWSKYF